MYRQQQLDDLLANRRILIAGYGREGKSTHALIEQYVPSAVVTIAANDDEIFRCLDESKNNPYDLIIKSPGIPTMKLEGLCNPETITSQTDLFLQIYGDQTIAVTGTKGKSTTTTLIFHVLKTSFADTRKVILAGNMGIPLFDILPQIDHDTVVVAEFSCHQLENIHRSPHIGIILNLYQEHLDHYHSYLDYQMAKMQMMLRQQPGDHCFYCTDSPDLTRLAKELSHKVCSTLHPYALNQALHSDIATLPTSLQGNHNLSNIYVACQATQLLGIQPQQFAQALATFHGLPHRLELVGTFHGITFYNDSISTIPEATIAAVEALKNVDTLILGGFDRHIDYGKLGTFLVQSPAGKQIRNLVLIGEAGQSMYDSWKPMSPSPLSDKNILFENHYPTLIAWCLAHTAAGSICLLSPAAASYDNFKNFEHRGDTYKEEILRQSQTLNLQQLISSQQQ